MPRIKISQAATEFNVSIPTVVDTLKKRGINIDDVKPNTRIDETAYAILVEAFHPDRKERERIDNLRRDKEEKAATETAQTPKTPEVSQRQTVKGPKVVGHINLDAKGNPVVEAPKPKPEPKPEPKPKAEPKPEPKPQPKPEPEEI
ncbi:MAG: hypothetical protein K2K55_08710, partial [Duncaniella sp.]|nr:hypothetical protein [Duncaniella sp.]